MVPMSMQVVVDSLLIQYTRQGSGPTLVIVHGWADRADAWRPVIDWLAENFDVIVPDLPGFGGSEAPHEPWGLDEYARLVGHFLDKLGVQSYVLAGHSNGGAISIRGTATGALCPDRLVLIASAGIRTTDKGRKLLLKSIAKAGKVLTSPLPAASRQRLRGVLYEKAGSDMLVAPHMEATFKRIVTDDIQDDARTITVPTLLLYGENDVATPVMYGEQLRQLIPHATLETVGGAGHFVHLEATDVIVRSILEFTG